MNSPIFHAILGVALLSVMDAFIKALVGRIPVFEVAFLRYAVGSIVVLTLAAIMRPGWPTVESLKANALRAVIVVVTATSFFYALGQLPLAEALILSFVSPSFTALFAALVLRERVRGRIIAALVAGFAGVVLIVAAGLGEHGGGHKTGSLAGVVAVIVSAIGYSASNVLLRARAQRDPLLLIVVIQNLGPFAMLAVPAAFVWTVPSGLDAAFLACIGLLGVTGHLFLARAYARAEANQLAPLDYTALIWALAIGYFVFAEVPSLEAGFGAVLIIGSAWLASRRR